MTKARLLHLFASETERGNQRQTAAELGDELRAVVVSAGFAGRQKDARVGWNRDRTSVDFS